MQGAMRVALREALNGAVRISVDVAAMRLALAIPGPVIKVSPSGFSRYG